MHQHPVIYAHKHAYDKSTSFSCAYGRAYETPNIGILISTHIYVPTICNMLMSMLMTQVHNFRVPTSVLMRHPT
jgi:hypothetical protein